MSKGSSSAKGGRTPMTPEAAARIQSAQARAHDGQVQKDTFAARAQSAAARNAASGGRTNGS